MAKKIEQLALEGFQGHDVQGAEVALVGGVKLIPTDPEHAEFISAARLRGDIRITLAADGGEGPELVLTGRVASWSHRVKSDTPGVEKVVGKASIRVDHIEGYRTPEEDEGDDPVESEDA